MECKYIAFYLSSKTITLQILLKKIADQCLYLRMFAYIKELRATKGAKGMKMNKVEKDLEISHLLSKWYDTHKRDLPWRETKDPYIIWISEIILQQTRVAQGLDYFQRFINRFPTVESLALADEDEVLKYWQGLGYYSRARNLHAAAKMIVDKFNGVFPDSYQDILSLKGVGEYTAAAIASISYNLPYAVVDGNVYRVISRLFAIDTPIDSTQGKKEFAELANYLMNDKQPAIHNQSIMEFGALQCVPKNPDCANCPLNEKCMAYAYGNVHSFPVKSNKTKVRNRYFNYLYIIYNGQTWIHRRNGKDIWTGLYEFPMIETAVPTDFVDLRKNETFQTMFRDAGELTISANYPVVKHILSHQVIYASFYQIKIEKPAKALESYVMISTDDLDKYAIPRLIDNYLSEIKRK